MNTKLLSLDIAALKELEANAPEFLPEQEKDPKEELAFIEKLNNALGEPFHNNFDNWDRSCWQSGLQASYDSIQAIAIRKHSHTNVLLSAPTGKGKSWLSRGIGFEFGKQYRTHKVCMVDEYMFLNCWHNSFSNNKLEIDRYNRLKERMIKSKLLIYDELGKNQLTKDRNGEEMNKFGNALMLIVNERYKRNLPTVFATQVTNENKLIGMVGMAFYRRALNYQKDLPNCIEIKFDKQ